MCDIRPSVLCDTFPLGSKTRSWEAEKTALRLACYIAREYGDRWLYTMSKQERQEIRAWLRRQNGVLDIHRASIYYALTTPIAAAAFSDKWWEKLEQAYSSNTEVDHA